MHIRKISWEQILPIWSEKLWPKTIRQTPIEPTSAMCLDKKWIDNMLVEMHYDLENMKFTPTFWGCFVDDNTLAGVNSGHMCIDKQYRSRGLWVDPKYRGLGIGKKLLLKTIAQGHHEGAVLCWSYPRLESWSTYASADFILQNKHRCFEWEESETGKNSRCFLEF